MEIIERILNLLPFVVALSTITWLYARARRRVTEHRHPRLDPESKYTVVISDTQLAIQDPNKNLQCIELDEIDRIVIRTNSLGPWFPDFWWDFYKADTLACSFPQGATGEDAAMDLASRLSGFDFESFGKAMASAEDAEFPCWQRPNNSFKPTPLRGAA